jgi:flagellar basal-body rod protein FlgF
VNYGFHLATGGALAAMRSIDLIANNMANAQSTGFKPDFIVAAQRLPERLDPKSPWNTPTAPSQELLEKLGGGLKFEHDRIDLRQGVLERTGNALDFAIEGDGFFVLAPSNPNASANGNAKSVDVTRAGNMIMDPDGTLRSADSGRPYQSEDGDPVKVDPELPFSIDGDGRIFQGGEEVTRFRIVRPIDPLSLQKLGGNVMRIAGKSEHEPEANYTVHRGALEMSNSDPVLTMVEITRQTRLMEANFKMIQFQDEMTGQAISGITRLG